MFQSDWSSKVAVYFTVFALLSNDIFASTMALQTIPLQEDSSSNALASHYFLPIENEIEVTKLTTPVDTDLPSKIDREDLSPRNEIDIVKTYARTMDFEVLDSASSLRGYVSFDPDITSTPDHILNVTRNATHYRLDGKYENATPIAIGVDVARLGSVAELNLVNVFFLDRQSNTWKMAETIGIDRESFRVKAVVPAETDYFAGMISSPEMPEAAAYVPTNVSEIEPASPATGMRLMQPPSANRQGSASLSYPLWIPQGRNGMTPPLAVNYNSDAGTGWMGLGWNIPQSMISVDTKWGVPAYSPTDETEPYVLNGEALFMQGNKRANRPSLNAQGELIPLKREVTGSTRFFPRVMASYSEIERKGTSPSNYYWVVTDASQNKNYYGTLDGTGLDTNSILQTSDGNIAQWYLSRTVDKWGNTIDYQYALYEEGTTSNMKNGGINRILKKITYTGFKGTSYSFGKYTIEFFTSNTRGDGTISLKMGLKHVDDRRLDSISVAFSGSEVVKYKFTYNRGSSTFFKTVLTAIQEYRNDQFFYEHTFTYYDDPLEYGSGVELDTWNPTPWLSNTETSSAFSGLKNAFSRLLQPSALNTSITSGFSVGGDVGVGPAVGIVAGQDKKSTFSAGINWGNHWTNTQRTMRDVNGDGLADVIFEDHNGNFAYYPVYRINGNLELGGKRNFEIGGIDRSFQKDLSYTVDYLSPGGFYVGMNWRNSTTKVKRTMTDYNGDGIPDMILDEGMASPRIHFGILESNGDISFSTSSEHTLNPVIKGVDLVFEDIEDKWEYQIVKTWKAPYSGTINISGTASMAPDLSGSSLVAIQHNDAIISSGFREVTPTLSYSPNLSLYVTKGDLLMFRVAAGEDGQQDLVNWNPNISYTSSYQQDGNRSKWHSSSSSDGFILSGKEGIQVLGRDSIKLDFNLDMTGTFSDDVFLVVQPFINGIAQAPIKDKLNPSNPNSLTNISTALSFIGQYGACDDKTPYNPLDTVVFTFSLQSTSNVDWADIECRPIVTYLEDCYLGKKQYPVLDYQTFNNVLVMEGDRYRPVDPSNYYEVLPQITIDTAAIADIYNGYSQDQDGIVYMTVKSGGNFLSRVAVHFIYKHGNAAANSITLHPINKTNGNVDLTTNLAWNVFNDNSNVKFKGNLVVGSMLSVEFFAKGNESENLANYINNYLFRLRFPRDVGTYQTVGGTTPSKNIYFSEYSELNNVHLGWGRFGWHPLSDETSLDAISTTELHDAILEAVKNGGTLPTDSASMVDGGDTNSVENQKFATLFPIRGERMWGLRTYQEELGEGENLDRYSVYGTHVSEFRYLGRLSSGFLGEEEGEIYQTPEPEQGVNPSYTASGALGYSKSSSLAINASAYGVSASSYLTDKDVFYSRSTRMFSDLNGDGYPDVLNESNDNITFYPTNSFGSHTTGIQSLALSEETLNKSTSWGVVASYNSSPPFEVEEDPEGVHEINEDARWGNLTKQSNFSDGVGLNLGRQRTRLAFIDFNGDGLADEYYDDQTAWSGATPSIRLNKGETFESASTSTTQSINSSSLSLSPSSAVGASTLEETVEKIISDADNGGSVTRRSWNLGANINFINNHPERTYIDITGDGLVDYLEYSNYFENKVDIYINEGGEFHFYRQIDDEPINEQLGQQNAFGISIKGTGTGALNIGLVKLKAAITGNGDLSVNGLASSMMDMNADGVPDYVEDIRTGKIKVYYATFARNGKLKSVENPLGGTFEITYEGEGQKNGYYEPQIKTHLSDENDEKMIWSMPQGKLVMRSVTIYDSLNVEISGEDLDGADAFTTRFAYDGGVYSRREREFLGFSRVATIAPSHYEDGVALLQDSCSHDSIEARRDLSAFYTYPEVLLGDKLTLVEVLRRYNMKVIEFSRLTDINQAEHFAYPYLSKLPETSYELHVHTWKDSIPVHSEFSGLIRTDTWYHQHVELISESNPDYEIRLVDTDPLSSTLGQVKGEVGNWKIISNLNSLGECATIFPAVTEIKKVNFPVVDDRAHYMPSKTSFEYDAYFNVTRVEDEGTGVATTPFEEIVDTMYYTHYVYKEQTNLCSIVSSLNVVYDDGIMYGLLVPDQDQEYEDAIVYAYYPTSSCYPSQMPEVGICTGDDTEFISVHRKEITDTIYIKEIDYRATYSGNLIALMTYFAPSNSANQTNVLQTHKVYQTNTNSSNLRRFAEVTALTSNNFAPERIRQYLGASTSSAHAESFVHYNTYGLADSIVGPENHAGHRNWSVITYDPYNLGIAIGTENQFGERVSSIYNYGLQQVQQTTDVNGHPMVYRYDDFARLTSIWAPREIYSSSNGPTIKFEYHPLGINPSSGKKNESVPVALTYLNTSNKGESVQTTTTSTIDNYRATLFTGGASSMTSSAHTATFTNLQGQAVQIQTETDYDPSGNGTAKTSILRVSGLSSVNTFGLADIQRRDTLISTSSFGIFRPFKTWTTGTSYYDYASRPVNQQSVWSNKDTTGALYTLVSTETMYEWLGGLSLNSGDYFTAYTTSAGTSTRSYIDSRGRQIATRNGNDILTEFEFDPLSQVVKVKDPVGLETQYNFDNFGRTTQEIHPDRGTTNTTYDEASNVTQVAWEGDTINYEYDHSRLKKKLMPSGASDPLYNVEYFYGANDGSNAANTVGRISKIIQGSSSSPFLVENYKYDELGNIHSESKTIDIPDVGTKTYVTKFFYDSFGRTLRIQYPDDEQVRYQYTTLGSLDGITSQMPSEAVQNIISDISYDGYDNVSHILYGNGTENFFTYHDVTRGLMANETKAKVNSSSGFAKVNRRDYSYNNRGLIDQVDFFVHPKLITPTTGNFTFAYSYDDVNRLTQTQLIEGGSTTYRLDMTYDHAGSIQTKSSKLVGSNLISNSDINYNGEYHPVSSSTHQIGEVSSYAELQMPGQPTPPDWGQRFTYNDQGSVEKVEKMNVVTGTYSQDRVMVWNAEQQLVAVSMDNHTNIQHYVYDHTGTRMLKSAYNQSSLSINDTNVGNPSYMDPYQVYVNAYFVESDFVDGLQKTKHYYMGMQRVASDISLQAIQAEPGLNKTSSSEASLNPTREESFAEEPAAQQNAVLEQFKHILLDQGIKEDVDYTEESLFASNQMDVLYPEYTSSSTLKSGSTGGDFTCCFNGDRYWYHPDYLGSVATVTNRQGIVHQFFLTNPWGENMHTYNQPTPGFDSPYRFNGKELDQETGYAYYGARYYDNQLSMWLSVDLLAHKYPRVSGYVFSNNNPLAFVDPDGNENIVVVGSQNAAGAGNKLMFVNQGIRAMREWSESSSQSAESRTMVLFTGGYTEDQIASIRSSVEGYGGSLVTVNSVDEMTSYINSKSTSCADLSDDRLSDKVTDMEMYSHGVPGAVEFGYGTENADKYRLDGSNVRDLNSGSFNGTESNISSFACRTAMGTNFSVVGSTFFIDRDGSLAQGISNATGASVMAFPVRTDYQFTLGTWSERRFGIPNAAPEMQTIDGAVFTPHGAAHPVQPGSTPFGVYQGELYFTPQ